MLALERGSTGSPDLEAGVRFYLQNGYWIGKGILDSAEVLEVRAEMHEIFRQQLRYLNLPSTEIGDDDAMHRDMTALLRADKERYIASLRLCAKLTSLGRLYLSPSLRQFAAEIGIALPVFQTAPVFHVLSEDLRIPGGYYGYGVHQDWPALQSGLDTVTLWVPFVSVDASNYTLDIIPKSHLDGVLPGKMDQNAYEADPASYREDQFVPVRAAPGDVLFMSCFLVHRSSLKGGKRMRVACSMRYENGADRSFIAHAYPSVHKRVVERDFLYRDLPTADEVRKVFAK